VNVQYVEDLNHIKLGFIQSQNLSIRKIDMFIYPPQIVMTTVLDKEQWKKIRVFEQAQIKLLIQSGISREEAERITGVIKGFKNNVSKN
jgi:hypothetical protein